MCNLERTKRRMKLVEKYNKKEYERLKEMYDFQMEELFMRKMK